jgi:hypothetical protein
LSHDWVAIEKNGKSEGNVDGLLRLRVAALQLGISFPTIKQWICKTKIGSNQTAGGHRVSRGAKWTDCFLRTHGKTEQQRKEEMSGRNQLVGPDRVCSRLAA